MRLSKRKLFKEKKIKNKYPPPKKKQTDFTFIQNQQQIF